MLLGSQQQVEELNTALFGGVLASFAALLLLGAPQVQYRPPARTHAHPSTRPLTRPARPPVHRFRCSRSCSHTRTR